MAVSTNLHGRLDRRLWRRYPLLHRLVGNGQSRPLHSTLVTRPLQDRRSTPHYDTSSAKAAWLNHPFRYIRTHRWYTNSNHRIALFTSVAHIRFVRQYTTDGTCDSTDYRGPTLTLPQSVQQFFTRVHTLVSESRSSTTSDRTQVNKLWKVFQSFPSSAWQTYQHQWSPKDQLSDFTQLLRLQKWAPPSSCASRIMNVLYTMRELQVPIYKYHYNVLLYALCRQSLMDDAVTLFAELQVGANPTELLEMYNIMIYGFGRQRNYNSMIDVYHQLQRASLAPNERTFYIIIRAFQTEKSTFRIISMFNEMTDRGTPPSVLLARNVIFYLVGQGQYQTALDIFAKFCSSEAEPESVSSPASKEPLQLHHDIYLNTTLMYSALKLRQMEKARHFFGVIKQAAQHPSPFPKSTSETLSTSERELATLSFREFVGYYMSRGDKDTVIQLFSSLALNGHCPDAFSLVPLLRIYLTHRDLNRVREVFRILRCAHPHLDDSLSVALVRLYTQEKQMGSAAELPAYFLKHHLPVSLDTYRVLLEGYATQKDFAGVQQTLRLMHQHRVMPNLEITEFLIGFYLANGYLQLTLPLYQYIVGNLPGKRASSSESIPDSQPKPTYRTYRKLIHQFAAAGHMDTALKLLQDMIQFNLQPVEDVFHIVMHGYININQPHMALEVLHIMVKQPYYTSSTTGGTTWNPTNLDSPYLPEDADVRYLSADTFSVLIRALCSLGDMREAERLAGTPLASVVAYNHLMHGYASRRQLATARRLFSAMVDEGFEPNEFSYSNLLKSIPRFDHLATSRRIFDHMIEHQVPLNAALFNSLIEAHAEPGDVDGAEWVYDQMQNHFHISPDPITYLALMRVCRMGGKPVRSSNLWKELLTHFPIQFDQVNQTVYPARYHHLALSWLIRSFYPIAALKAGTAKAELTLEELRLAHEESQTGEQKDESPVEATTSKIQAQLKRHDRTLKDLAKLALEPNHNLTPTSPSNPFARRLTLALPHLHHQLTSTWNWLSQRKFPFTHLHYNDYFLALVYGFRIDEALELIRGRRIYVIGFDKQLTDAGVYSQVSESEEFYSPGSRGKHSKPLTADWSASSPAVAPFNPYSAQRHQTYLREPLGKPSVTSDETPTQSTLADSDDQEVVVDPGAQATDSSFIAVTPAANNITPPSTEPTVAQPSALYFYPVTLEAFFSVLKTIESFPAFRVEYERWIGRMFQEHRELFR
ncbi:hypothetical protein IWQ62_000312 [Dispira parvispora]|uniref:Pentacotripeptide-repeat region of PRORP domain-containing protein n=1 Tax=Dispira parvispora TaxID=1520584 RepID=A0A9W8E669_9FUNG|nr:hypothetical protein IWQ62_000312 [Dispira parvispora]